MLVEMIDADIVLRLPIQDGILTLETLEGTNFDWLISAPGELNHDGSIVKIRLDNASLQRLGQAIQRLTNGQFLNNE